MANRYQRSPEGPTERAPQVSIGAPEPQRRVHGGYTEKRARVISFESRRRNGAGGGNRTIRAYSFYVTYCKHTNARTAQTSVCPPPMYKIMYKSSKAE